MGDGQEGWPLGSKEARRIDLTVRLFLKRHISVEIKDLVRKSGMPKESAREFLQAVKYVTTRWMRGIQPHHWIFGTGAAEIMTNDKNDFIEGSYEALAVPLEYLASNGGILHGYGRGRVIIHLLTVQGRTQELSVGDVLYTPKAPYKLMGACAAEKGGRGIYADFKNRTINAFQGDQILGTLSVRSEVFTLNTTTSPHQRPFHHDGSSPDNPKSLPVLM